MLALVNEILIFLGVTTVVLNRIVTENLKIGLVGDRTTKILEMLGNQF
jgi:hypothetical protein